jgi:trehalose synthase
MRRVESLARTHTVIAPDLPGHGASGSGGGDYSVGALAAGLRDLVLALGHDRLTLVGHSLGGGIAMQFAYQFPEMVERLVLVSSGGLGPEVSPVLRAAALPGADLFIAATAGLGQRIGAPVGRALAAIGTGGQRVDASDLLYLPEDGTPGASQGPGRMRGWQAWRDPSWSRSHPSRSSASATSLARSSPPSRRSPSGRGRRSRDGRSGTSTRRRGAAVSPRSCTPCCPTCEGPGWTHAGPSCARSPSSSRSQSGSTTTSMRIPATAGHLGRRRDLYETALRASATQLAQLIQPDDVIYLHDPQTAGLVPAMKEMGLKVVWRCHIGADHPGELARSGWDFLRPYVKAADAYVFSRAEYVWEGLDRSRVWLMPPAIDPFAPKNQDLDPDTVDAIVGEIGIGARMPESAPTFVRGDGTPGRVERSAELLQEEPLPANARLVIQVSRWDRLKDPRGLLECFARYLDDPGVHLALVGPTNAAVSDDPEGAAVYGDVAGSWRRLPEERRRRAHLANLPMDDLDENAAMVNALQRRAEVIVQKSLAEGFGLTVAEAMWKARPVVASRVGGIQDQIVDGKSGLLVDDPTDLAAFGAAIRGVLDDAALAGRLGEAARQRVKDRFLAIGRLREYVELVGSLIDGP